MDTELTPTLGNGVSSPDGEETSPISSTCRMLVPSQALSTAGDETSSISPRENSLKMSIHSKKIIQYIKRASVFVTWSLSCCHKLLHYY